MNEQICQTVSIRNSRIWLPKEVQECIGKEFIEVEVEGSLFITKITEDGRFFIPKSLFRDRLNDCFEIKVRVLKNLARPQRQTSNGLIDVLAFVPEKTLSGYGILALKEKNQLRLWYSTKGRPNELLVNRFVPVDFLVLLGYYQAEGGKAKLHKRRGREMNFTNADLSVIEDFLYYLNYLMDISLCKATVRYNGEVDYEVIREVRSKLISLGLKEDNIRDKSARRIRKYTVKIWISNSILGEVVNNMMNKVRESLIEEKSNSEGVVYFLRGLIAGDGNFCGVRDKHGSLHSWLGLFEANQKFMEDYQELLKLVNIEGRVNKAKGKNLYVYRSNMNWYTLLHLFRIGLLEKSADNYQRLVRTIRSHRNYKFGWLKDKQLTEKVNEKAIIPF